MLALSHLTHLGQECVAPAGLESAAESFRRDGVAVLKAFAEPDEVATMRLSMEAMVEDWWQSERAGGGGDEHVFRTDGDQAAAQGSKDYFMSSGDKVRFFEEPGTHSRDAAKAPPVLKLEDAALGWPTPAPSRGLSSSSLDSRRESRRLNSRRRRCSS